MHVEKRKQRHAGHDEVTASVERLAEGNLPEEDEQQDGDDAVDPPADAEGREHAPEEAGDEIAPPPAPPSIAANCRSRVTYDDE